jgi:hypothetical protein
MLNSTPAWSHARVSAAGRCVVIAMSAAACGATLLAQPPSSVSGPQPVPMRGFSATQTVNMRIYMPAGRVRVAVWDRDSISVSGTIGAASSMFGGGNASNVKFGVEPLRTGDTKLAEADWTVTVPRRAKLWIKVTVGTIDVVGTAGELEVYAVGGSITVRQASGITSVESIDAGVRIEDVRGDLRVRGGKALLVLRDVTATTSVTSVSGGVTVSGLAPDCRVETIGGNITFDATRMRGVLAELQTHSGEIRVGVDATRAPVLDLSSRSGRVVKPSVTGAAANGRVVARSFKGAVTALLSPERSR